MSESVPTHAETSHPELHRRALRDLACDHLLLGRGVVLYGGRGMGKSYLIRQLTEDLSQSTADCFVLAPPAGRTDIPGYLTQLGRAIGIEADPHTAHPVEDLVAEWRDRNPERKLVLLYDEVDGFVRSGDAGARFFGSLERARKQSGGRVGILAAGGLGLVTLGRVWSSPFVNRAERMFAPRFNGEELRELAAPLALGDAEPDVLAALETHSGLIPALCVRGLRGLFEVAPEQRTQNQLLQFFNAFQDRHGEFILNLWAALGEGSDHDEPAQVWRVLNAAESVLTTQDVGAALPHLSPIAIEVGLTVLRAAGLVEARRRGAVEIRLVPSVLSLPARNVVQPTPSLRDRLREDLTTALLYIHRWGTTSYWRDGRLLPDAVFQTAISITLAARGWTEVAQETEQGGGRTDVTAGHPDFPGEKALIEVKVWGRSGSDDLQSQLEKYRAPETTALATAMIAVRPDLDGETFRTRCLMGEGMDAPATPPLLAVENPTRSEDWPSLPVDHYLLRLPRGP